MANARNNILILDTGHVARIVGGGAGAGWLVKDETTPGTVITALPDGDVTAQNTTAVAVPAGAPVVGAQVFVKQGAMNQPGVDPSEAWFVVGYFTTPDQLGAAPPLPTWVILQNGQQPLLQVAVPFSGIKLFGA